MNESKDPLAGEGTAKIAEKLSSFSLHRRITILVLFCSLLVVGSIAAFGLKQELIPDGMARKNISIHVHWRDGSG